MKTATAPDSLIEIIPTAKPQPKPLAVVDSGHKVLTNVKPSQVVKSLTDKEKIAHILSALEEIRLSLRDTKGQGFLFNATASIRLYLQR
jgi:hypothetical protein